MIPHLATNLTGDLEVFDGSGKLIYLTTIEEQITEMEAFYFQPEGMYSYHFTTSGGVKSGSFIHLFP